MVGGLFHVNFMSRSLPTRERGLKLPSVLTAHIIGMSLPTRERGLKWRECFDGINKSHVAPHAGAWIEMSLTEREIGTKFYVAPHAGAWIEIYPPMQ